MRRLAVACFAVVALALQPAMARQARIRTVYLTALDQKGQPVRAMAPADLVLKEGGKPREVVKIEPASAPLQLILIIDDNGTGLFRQPVAHFVNALLGRGEFAIWMIHTQVQKLAGMTRDVTALQKAINQLGPRPATPEGGQLLEGINDAARELRRREAVRPVIVVITVGGVEHSPLRADQVLEALNDSGAELHVISMPKSRMRQSPPVARPSDLLDSPMNLDEVLGDGPKQSGGRREEIVATAGTVNPLQQIADELLHEFVVTYAMPDGVKPSGRLSVATTRKGVTIRAPTRVPAR